MPARVAVLARRCAFLAFLVLAPRDAGAAPRTKPSSARAQCLAAHEEAQALRSQKRPHAAHEKLVQCAKSECPGVVRRECAERLPDVDKDAPTVALEAHDDSGADTTAVTVSLDGTKVADRLTGMAVDVEPGEHDFVFERADGKSVKVHVLVVEGEKNRKVLGDFATLAPKVVGPPPPPKKEKAELPVPSLVLGGVAVLGLGFFTYFALSGKGNEHDLAGSCGPRCTDDEIRPVKTSYLAADISLVIAVAAAATAVVLALPTITGGGHVKTASLSLGSPPAPWMPRVKVQALP